MMQIFITLTHFDVKSNFSIKVYHRYCLESTVEYPYYGEILYLLYTE